MASEQDLLEMILWWRKHRDFIEDLRTNIDFINRGYGDQSIIISNAHFKTGDGLHMSATITVDADPGRGWQWPIQAPGGAKCLVCDDLNFNNQVICDECRTFVAVLRRNVGADRIRVLVQSLEPWNDNLEKLVDLLADKRFQFLLEQLTMDNFKQYLEEQIADAARDS